MDPSHRRVQLGSRPLPSWLSGWVSPLLADAARPLLAGLLLAGLLLTGLGAPPAWAALPPGNAVTDPAAILRNALPIESVDLQRAPAMTCAPNAGVP